MMDETCTCAHNRNARVCPFFNSALHIMLYESHTSSPSCYLICTKLGQSDLNSPFTLSNSPLFRQQLRYLHLAPATTYPVLQPTACTALCLSRNPSRSSSSRRPHPAAACPPALSMALDQYPTPLRAVPFSHTLLLPHHLQAPPWASAAPVALLVLAWALLSEHSAPLVSDLTCELH